MKRSSCSGEEKLELLENGDEGVLMAARENSTSFSKFTEDPSSQING
jgi:hypothetical protein